MSSDLPQPTEFRDLGRIAYREAWDLQEALLAENVRLKLAAPRGASPHSLDTRHYLLFCEHPHVYTLGKSGDPAHLLIPEAQRAALGIEYYRINRGGDITYHGPGQLVGYPILDLEKLRTDIGWYLRSLEEAVIRMLESYGLEGGRIAGATGVWIGTEGAAPRKICAMGVRCSRWVTMHGFALNLSPDLGLFSHIVPCGISDKGVTSMEAELGYAPDPEEVKARLLDGLCALLGLRVQP
ncbi:MAG: lipoyl(octanoyl) transferase LipB [Bacteroidia bacterium]|nr:lipoyl(octanoyl) transferase LipB [Bacteroidia bacterium]